MPVTLKEIATKLNLSIPTVSRILNCSMAHLYREETVERVRKMAGEMGYRANAYARATRTGMFGNVALLMSQDVTFSHLPTELLWGIEDALCANEKHLTIARLADERLVDGGYMPRVLREWWADGLLVNYHFNFPPQMEQVVASLPSVWINSVHEHDCAYPDERQAGVDATAWLLRRGFTRVAYLQFMVPDGIYLHFSIADRIEGYKAAMAQAGLAPRVMQESAPSFNARLEYCRRLLTAEDAPQAIVVASDTATMPLCVAAHTVGQPDLPMVVFADSVARGATRGYVPTMVVPHRRVGAAAVEMLLTKIAHPTRKLPPARIAFAAEPTIADEAR
jgi:DNA-binding LacI/PurR family transcriptional regulator